jgi:hypothetical protein
MEADPVVRILRHSEALLYLAERIPEENCGLAFILHQLGVSLKKSGEELDDKLGVPIRPSQPTGAVEE